MNIKCRILIERIHPENKLIAPHWLATVEGSSLEASGPNPAQALEALQAKLLAYAWVKYAEEANSKAAS